MRRLIFQLLQLSLCYRFGKQDSHGCHYGWWKMNWHTCRNSPINKVTATPSSSPALASFRSTHHQSTSTVTSSVKPVTSTDQTSSAASFITTQVTTSVKPVTVTSTDQAFSSSSVITKQETTDGSTVTPHTTQRNSPHTVTATSVTVAATTHDAMSTSSQHATSPSNSLTPLSGLTPLSEWKTVDNREYYINRNNLSYSEADDECQRFEDAALTWYLVPDSFAGVVEHLGLEPGFFWVGGAKSDVVNRGKALLLNITFQGTNRQSTVTEAGREQRHYSLCSRIANIADVLNEPFFKKILEDMDMEAKSTSQAKRKLSSADNGDTSSKVIGSSFGIFLFTAILVSIIAMDIPRLFSCCRCGKRFSLRKKESNTTNSSDC